MDLGQSIPSYPPGWLSASYYNNIPHNEVNWASLAQQWIAMRQAGADQEVGQTPPLPPSQPPAPPGPDMQKPGGGEAPVFPPSAHNYPFHQAPPLEPQHQTQEPEGYKWGIVDESSSATAYPSREGRGALLATPEIPPLPDGYYERPPLPETLWPGRGPRMFRPPTPNLPPGIRHNHPPTPAPQSYYHSQAQDWYTEDGGSFPGSSYDSSVSMTYGPGSGFPNQDMDYRKWKSPFYNQRTWMVDDRSSSNSPDYPSLDQTQRKFLPAWIREGLEKMEREKNKKEQETGDSLELEKQKLQERAKKGKSRFESDSESDNEENERDSPKHTTVSSTPKEEGSWKDADVVESSKSPAPRRVSRFSRSPISEEEYKEQVLGLLKKWMTEILLEVTNSEITDISSQVHVKHLKKAQPKMLAQSSALAAITSFGDAGSDDSSDGESDFGSEEEGRKEAHPAAFKMPLGPPSIVRPVSKQRKQSKPISVNADSPISQNGDEKKVETCSEGKTKSSSQSIKEKKERKRSSSKSDTHKSSRSSRSRSRERERKHRRRERSRSPSPSKERTSKSKRKRKSRSRSKDRTEKKSRKRKS